MPPQGGPCRRQRQPVHNRHYVRSLVTL